MIKETYCRLTSNFLKINIIVIVVIIVIIIVLIIITMLQVHFHAFSSFVQCCVLMESDEAPADDGGII